LGAPVQPGVPQDSVTGPLWFLLFINDLPNYVSPESTTRLFADGCALYRSIHTDQDAKALCQDSGGLQSREKDWLMEFTLKMPDTPHSGNKQEKNIQGTITHPWTPFRRSIHVQQNILRVNEKLPLYNSSVNTFLVYVRKLHLATQYYNQNTVKIRLPCVSFVFRQSSMRCTCKLGILSSQILHTIQSMNLKVISSV